MQVLVVGGTGTLGRQIARRALDEGHQVRCMVRTPRKASFLQEWGCELTRGDLLEPDSLDYALEGMDAVIDAATSRPDDPKSIYVTDWDGKLNLLRACERAKVKRFVFLSLLGAHRHRSVPLMDIKACTENLLEASDFDYTILQGAAFMQGVISLGQRDAHGDCLHEHPGHGPFRCRGLGAFGNRAQHVPRGGSKGLEHR